MLMSHTNQPENVFGHTPSKDIPPMSFDIPPYKNYMRGNSLDRGIRKRRRKREGNIPFRFHPPYFPPYIFCMVGRQMTLKTSKDIFGLELTTRDSEIRQNLFFFFFFFFFFFAAEVFSFCEMSGGYLRKTSKDI